MSKPCFDVNFINRMKKNWRVLLNQWHGFNAEKPIRLIDSEMQKNK